MVQKITDLPGPAKLVEDPDDIDNPILAYFLMHWRRHRGDKPLPLSSSFVVENCGSQIPWVSIVEALPGYEDFRYTLVGSHVCEYFLADGTGMTVREAFAALPELELNWLVWVYRQACVQRCPIRFTAPGGVIDGVPYPDFDCGYFPYAPDGVDADRLVVVFTFNYQEFLRTRSMVSLLATPTPLPAAR